MIRRSIAALEAAARRLDPDADLGQLLSLSLEHAWRKSRLRRRLESGSLRLVPPRSPADMTAPERNGAGPHSGPGAA